MISQFRVWWINVFITVTLVFAVSVAPATAQEVTDDETEVKQGSGRISVPLSGRGLIERNSNLTVIPNTLEFGLVEVGSSVTRLVTISHSGNADAEAVVMGDVMYFGQNADEFSSSDFSGQRILFPGESIQVSVTLTPLLPGKKSAGMRLSIIGATSPFILLFNGQSRYPLTSDLGSSDFNVQFGEALQNTNSSAKFVVTNEGESDAPVINVSSIQLSGINANAFTSDFQPRILSPGEQLEITLTLDTSTPGIKSAMAEVLHDGNNSALQIALQATVNEPQAVPVNFSVSTLNTARNFQKSTTLQFGPDGKLYVGEMDGPVLVYNVQRNGKDNYSATLEDTINLIKNVSNHNDDGTPNAANKRLLTGIHVTGTAANPIIYAASSDPRQAAGPSGNDSNLDTNSGILHKLTKNGNNWTKLDLVRGLPRSEENHVANGLVLVNNKIYINMGGHTNEGVPSNNFAELAEYALSAAVLEIDLGMIGNSTYDIPTLNGPSDQFDPFGGHDGLNQAKLVQNGPIKIFTTGLRNAYDIVYTEAGRFYVWDNGPNTGWGGKPGADCLNTIDNGGNKSGDGLHLISRGYYAGHPNPTRGNKANTFGGQSPIEGPANPEECIYQVPGPASGALTTNNPSTNGLEEYTASNFGNAMKNDLLAVAFNKTIFRVQLNGAGNQVTSKSVLKNNIGQTPLDLTAQADNEIFPGTIWVADHNGNDIIILEPADY
ncbi:MAG: choice-of-anchor D domain-containing protein [Granulosicoccus sp.]